MCGILRCLEVTQPDELWESAGWYKHQPICLFLEMLLKRESIFCIALTFKAPQDACMNLHHNLSRGIQQCQCMSFINKVLDQTRFQLNWSDAKSDKTYEEAINLSVLVPLPLSVCCLLSVMSSKAWECLEKSCFNALLFRWIAGRVKVKFEILQEQGSGNVETQE